MSSHSNLSPLFPMPCELSRSGSKLINDALDRTYAVIDRFFVTVRTYVIRRSVFSQTHVTYCGVFGRSIYPAKKTAIFRATITVNRLFETKIDRFVFFVTLKF